jgi:hypothetical protein
MTIEGITFVPCAYLPGWFVEGALCRDSESAESRALRIYSATLSQGYFAISGWLNEDSGHRVYLAPSDDVIAVANAFDVGGHAEHDKNARERALMQIRETDQKNPLLPYFADTAGFKARFSQQLTEDMITFMLGILTDVEPMIDEEQGTAERYLREQHAIHLWWD